MLIKENEELKERAPWNRRCFCGRFARPPRAFPAYNRNLHCSSLAESPEVLRNVALSLKQSKKAVCFVREDSCAAVKGSSGLLWFALVEQTGLPIAYQTQSGPV